MRIAVCIPVYGNPKAGFTQSLARMISKTMLANISGPNGPIRPVIDTFMETSCSVSLNRRQLAQKALAWKADYLLWADADHTFPPDALLRLLSHGKPVVGVNYRKRAPDRMLASGADQAGQMLEPKPEGLEEVGSLGLGLCLVQAIVLGAVKPPYFLEDIAEDGESAVGEDAYFFQKVRSAGIPVFVDHALSMETGHIAETILKFGEDANVDSVLPPTGHQPRR